MTPVMALAMAWTSVSAQHSLVYPIPESELVVQDFTIPDHWPRAFGLEIRWNSVAAIWGARDPQSDVLYLFREYSAEAEPATHAAALRAHADWIPGLVDPSANGRPQSDGYHLVRVYRTLGLRLESVDNVLESGILSVWQRMRSGRLKVFASLTKYIEEQRFYRRNEKAQIVKEHDALQDAARCLVSGISRLRSKPKPTPPCPQPSPSYGGPHSWMAY